MQHKNIIKLEFEFEFDMTLIYTHYSQRCELIMRRDEKTDRNDENKKK